MNTKLFEGKGHSFIHSSFIIESRNHMPYAMLGAGNNDNKIDR